MVERPERGAPDDRASSLNIVLFDFLVLTGYAIQRVGYIGLFPATFNRGAAFEC